MMHGINKREIFDNVPDGLPDGFIEVAYRYASLGGRTGSPDLETTRLRKVNFGHFIDNGFWWENTPEGDAFWRRIYEGNYEPEESRTPIPNFDNFIDFKHYD